MPIGFKLTPVDSYTLRVNVFYSWRKMFTHLLTCFTVAMMVYEDAEVLIDGRSDVAT